MSNPSLYKAAEKALYNYQAHKRTVEAYEARCMRRQRPQTEAGVRVARKSDPTALGGIAMAERPPEVIEAARWCWAIETAWAELLTFAPARARLMEVYYGLNNATGRDRDKATSTRMAIERELSIEQATFYRWKNDVVDAVIHAGIQCGVLVPYHKAQPPG